MLKKILLALALIVVAFLIVVAMQPADFRVERSATIAAPPSVVFAQVNDLHRWQDFSPWAKLDPNARNTFEGPPAGAGAAIAWSGNSQIGEGRMTITESRPSSLVRMRLDFVKPMESTAVVEFTFRPEAGHTVVSWSMAGRNNFVAKAFCLFVNMDKTIGGDFENGLASLKRISEAAAKRNIGA